MCGAVLVKFKRMGSGGECSVAAPACDTNGVVRVVTRMGYCAGMPATVLVATGGQQILNTSSRHGLGSYSSERLIPDL